MIHRGTYDGTIYHNPVNRFCIISVKTADKEVPQEARSTRRYKDHLIRFVATGYELPRTDAVELELDGEWTKGKYGVQLQVEQWHEIVPKTRDGVEGYPEGQEGRCSQYQGCQCAGSGCLKMPVPYPQWCGSYGQRAPAGTRRSHSAPAVGDIPPASCHSRQPGFSGVCRSAGGQWN